MPRTFAEERVKLTALTTKPGNILAPTITELNAGKDLQTRTLKGESRLSATGSETFSEPLKSDAGNPTDFGASNFEGSLTVFRFLDATGKPVALEDDAWALLKDKGTELWIYKRVGPLHSALWAVGDEDVELYHVLTDNPQAPSDEDTGYIKRVIPLGVQGDSSIGGVTIAAAA